MTYKPVTTMNEAQRIFCDGAAVAYRDAAGALRNLIAKAPPEVKTFLDHLSPLADSMEKKAVTVYEECERYMSEPRQ